MVQATDCAQPSSCPTLEGDDGALVRARITLPDRLPNKTTVDLYRSSTQYRAIARQQTWSTSATRTIKIVVSGTTGRPRMDPDTFVVVK
jgi:hypothetical protein